MISKPPIYYGALLTAVLLLSATFARATFEEDVEAKNYPALFVRLIVNQGAGRDLALQLILDNWQRNFTPMALETITLMRDPLTAARLLKKLQETTGNDYRFDINRWYQWLWQQPPQPHPHYAQFKSQLYSLIDHRFGNYFSDERASKIRLDEVRWGGVVQDGIPPLRSPKMLPGEQADYLSDDNVVFGLEVNGDARAYPKRILAWHEMFTDTIGGEALAGVYCTLCGSMILYKTLHNGIRHELGTSGFLFRSNKLMYDRATQSLWSTMLGTPVIGPLADKNIQLERLSVVTTTWGEWRRRHPQTQVLSIDTGHRRNYDEGVAYHDYFATDELMFTVPTLDNRLKNKAQVVGLYFPSASDRTLAIHAEFLAANPLYHDQLAGQNFVVATDTSGANRVYESKAVVFVSYDSDRRLIDTDGGHWTLSESELTRDDGETLARLPAHRAFWFGWYSAHPDTRLVH